MERNTSIAIAKQIMGDNFLGPDELSSIANDLMISPINNKAEIIKPIPFSEEMLQPSNYGTNCLLCIEIESSFEPYFR